MVLGAGLRIGLLRYQTWILGDQESAMGDSVSRRPFCDSVSRHLISVERQSPAAWTTISKDRDELLQLSRLESLNIHAE